MMALLEAASSKVDEDTEDLHKAEDHSLNAQSAEEQALHASTLRTVCKMKKNRIFAKEVLSTFQ
eukprot:SAG31_NODE_9484_length_1269_cov_18.098291_2_plen_64_part_00